MAYIRLFCKIYYVNTGSQSQFTRIATYVKSSFCQLVQELFAPVQVCVQFIYFHSAKHQTLYIATIKQCNSGQLTQLTQQTNNAVKVPRNHNDVRFNDIGYIHFYITERTHPSPKVSLFSFIWFLSSSSSLSILCTLYSFIIALE